jgi:tetratricopeptide (TPR) repeat protein
MYGMAQPSNNLQGPHNGSKHRPWLRWVILIILLTFIAIAILLWALNSKNPLLSIIPIIIPVIGIVITLFQWLFPVSSSSGIPDHHHLSPNAPQLATASPLAPPSSIQPTIGYAPVTQQLPPISSSQEKATYHGIIGFPPLTDSRTIQQREKLVKEIYAQLLSPDITAIVLTGIGGVGKSTLAALIHRYVEEQRRLGKGPFTAEALWLRINPAVTMNDLVGTIFDALGRPLLDMDSLTPQNLAVALFNALNATDSPRLLILDQFENLLDTQTGYALPDSAGVGEWLDALNSQPCRCRVLLTSRLWPLGTREYPPTYMQEYHSLGLEIAEGIELLRKQGVGQETTEAELRTAVKRCAGHAFALALLAAFLRRNRSLSLTTLINNPIYAQLWTGDIARNLLNSIYTQQLTEVQRKLLLAFSIYREPVPLDAVNSLLDFNTELPEAQTLPALDGLLRQHLLQATGEGRYQLHAIVADYAHGHFIDNNALQEAHARAAQYYLQQAAQHCPSSEQRRRISDVQPFIEAIWQLCQAGQWQKAYGLIEQENIFKSVKRWGGNTILLELYELLLPLDKWHPQPGQAAHIYNTLGYINRTLGQMEQAREQFERALIMCREQGDRRGEGWAFNGLGRVYSILGQRDRARSYFEQALNLSRELGDRGDEVSALNNLAGVYRAMVQRKQAQEYCEQALSICKEIGDRGKLATTLSNLGEVYSAKGRMEQARQYYEEALSIQRELGIRGQEGWTLNNLGKLYEDWGQQEQARIYLEQALSIRREVGDRIGESRTLKNLGKVYAALGQNELALACLEQSLQMCQHFDRWGEGKTLNNLGKFYHNLGKKEQARDYLQRALTIRRQVSDRSGEAITLNDLGQVYADLGQSEQALSCYQQALHIRREIDAPGGEGSTLYRLGSLYLDQQKYNLALACFVLAKTIFAELQSPKLPAVQSCIEELQNKIGEPAFRELLAQVELQAWQVVEPASLADSF